MRFYLGTHEPAWLNRLHVPLFVSHTRLRRIKRKFPQAITGWALDSGGFTELSRHGGWQTTIEEYVEAVERYANEVGMLEWAAPMDWMCEPSMLRNTGLKVKDHQIRTVANYLDLRERAPDLPFVPVLQGWEPSDYLDCIGMYERAGVDLREQSLVGVGSVCRRQGTDEIYQLFSKLHAEGLNLHGFGVKLKGIRRYADLLTSSDSLAWSRHARNRPPLPGCVGHKSCANCPRYALQYRRRILAGLDSY